MNSTAVFLPWLPLDTQLTFGPYNVAPLEQLLPRVHPEVARALEDIGRTFVGFSAPNRASLMWPVDEGECPTFGSPDLDEYNLAVRLLALGVLIENEFFSHRDPATTLNFEVVAQRFTLGCKHFAVEIRRRDGRTLSGSYRFDEARFTRPIVSPSKPRLVFNEPLLRALAGCLTSESSLSSRIAQSAVPFLLANRLDGSSSFQSDLFWLATAIEQLLAVSDRPKGTTITKTFSGILADLLAVPSSPSRQKMVTAWGSELYGRRSEVHGRPHRHQRWDTGWHAFLASHAFGLLVKRLLAADERYVLSDADEIALEAFSLRVGRMRSTRLESADSVWDETDTDARLLRTRRQVAARLRDADVSGDS